MLAAIASADITPSPGPILQGHFSEMRSHSVMYPLEVRLLLLRSGAQTACIVAIDAIGVTADLAERIRRRLQRDHGISPDRAMICASHTHCAPPVLPCLGMSPDAEFVSSIERAIAQCTDRASAQLEPVTVGLGTGSAHFNINRRPLPGTTAMTANYGGLVDRRARLLRLDRADGSPLAVLFHYSCHPTTKSGSDGVISPDYPGVARAFIESQLRCAALFLPGCFGNVRPLILNDKGTFGSADQRQLEDVGRQLGTAVCAAAGAVRTRPDDRLSARQMELVLRFGAQKSPAELEQIACRSDTPMARAVLAPWASRMLQMQKTGGIPDAERSVMQLMQVGPLLLVTIPGEPVQEIGHAIERRFVLRSADCQEIWPVGYTNDMLGYLCTPQQHIEGGYEPTAYAYYGRPAPWADEEKSIIECALALL